MRHNRRNPKNIPRIFNIHIQNLKNSSNKTTFIDKVVGSKDIIEAGNERLELEFFMGKAGVELIQAEPGQEL